MELVALGHIKGMDERTKSGNKKRGMGAGRIQQGLLQVFGANLQRKTQGLWKLNDCQ